MDCILMLPVPLPDYCKCLQTAFLLTCYSFTVVSLALYYIPVCYRWARIIFFRIFDYSIGSNIVAPRIFDYSNSSNNWSFRIFDYSIPSNIGSFEYSIIRLLRIIYLNEYSNIRLSRILDVSNIRKTRILFDFLNIY